MLQTDVLITGSGIAEAPAALRLADNPKRRIALITRAPDPNDSNTNLAQGGIIHRGPDDQASLLEEDILAAGAGASLPEAARILAEEGPRLLDEIIIKISKIEFDRNSDNSLNYTQEAAHQRRRDARWRRRGRGH